MGETRNNIEVGRGGSSHIGNFLQSSGAVGAIFWIGDVGAINGHREALIRGTYGFIMTGDGENGKEEFGRDLETGGGIYHNEGGRDIDGKDIYQKETSDSGSVGGPPAHIRILRTTRDR